MTKNQIEYQKLQETKRYNDIFLKQKDWKDKADVAVAQAKQQAEAAHFGRMDSETYRHNAYVENVALGELGIKGQQLAISQEGLELSKRQTDLNERSVAVSEGNLDVARQNANTAARNAEASMKSAEASAANAAASYLNAQTNQARAAEDVRHNKATEAETTRTNMAYEEIGRQNATSSAIQAASSAQNVEINKQQADTQAKRVENEYELGLIGANTKQYEAETGRYAVKERGINDFSQYGLNMLKTGAQVFPMG